MLSRSMTALAQLHLSTTDADPVVVVAALAREITTIIVSLPIVDRPSAHDGPMGGVKGIPRGWFGSIPVRLWISSTSTDKPENNGGS
jgi:hypothetical protein